MLGRQRTRRIAFRRRQTNAIQSGIRACRVYHSAMTFGVLMTKIANTPWDGLFLAYFVFLGAPLLLLLSFATQSLAPVHLSQLVQCTDGRVVAPAADEV